MEGRRHGRTAGPWYGSKLLSRSVAAAVDVLRDRAAAAVGVSTDGGREQRKAFRTSPSVHGEAGRGRLRPATAGMGGREGITAPVRDGCALQCKVHV